MRRAIAIAVAALAAAGCGGSDDKGADANGVVTVRMWHGQVDEAKQILSDLAADFNRTHPKIKVVADSGGVQPDEMTQKVTTALTGDSYPDIAYIFGSDVANVARSPKALDLTARVKDPRFAWNDFWPAARDAAVYQGRVRALPAIADSLSMMYNRRLFRAAGVPEPKPDWTWQDFRALAQKLTDRGKNQFGTAWPVAGDEDTVWRIWPLVWQQGGDVVSKDGKGVAFGGAPGRQAFDLLHAMAVQDHSVYLDSTVGSQKMYRLFNNNKIAMVMAGPWALLDTREAKIDFGVVRLPGFGPQHTTVSGADTWMLFDHGGANADAAVEFMRWMLAPEQELRWITATGSLPVRPSTMKLPGYKKFLSAWPGVEDFAGVQDEARARPVTPAYPKVSKAVGKALSALLVGRASPEEALKQAEAESAAALRTPTG